MNGDNGNPPNPPGLPDWSEAERRPTVPGCDVIVRTLLVRHEALFDRTGVKGPRRLAVAAAGLKLEEAWAAGRR